VSELSVGSTAVRPWSVPTAGRAVVAVVRRDSAERRFLGIPFVLDFLFGIVNLVIFAFISRVLRQPAHAQLGHTGSYFDFVAVGITFMLVVQAAGTQITARVQEEQRSGTLEMLTAQPVTAGAIAVGVSAYPMGFAVLRSAAYLGVASALLGLDVGSADWMGVVVVLLLGGAATMCLGMALAAVTVAFDSGITVGRLLIVAVAFLSGTYFPVATLPPVLRWLSVLLPTRIALDGLRAALSGNGWAGSALLLAAAVTVGVPLGVWLFGQALRLAVSRGTLTRG
jgi:ABC-2 type transport system permease protein